VPHLLRSTLVLFRDHRTASRASPWYICLSYPILPRKHTAPVLFLALPSDQRIGEATGIRTKTMYTRNQTEEQEIDLAGAVAGGAGRVLTR
jgi:hypothetical protein